MLENVIDYDPAIPKFKPGFVSSKWSALFAADWVFGLTTEKSQDGKQKKKNDVNRWAGKAFRKLHVDSIDYIEEIHDGQSFETPFPVPSIASNNLDTAFFQHWTNKINMPLVLKGFLEGADILDYVSPDNLVKKHGTHQIKCISNYKNHDSNLGQNVETYDTTLKEFLINPKYKDFYLNNFLGILSEEDFLDKCNGRFIEQLQDQKTILTQLFVSRTVGSGSQLHTAGGENFFLNIKGRKKWHFIDPSYTSVIQPAMTKYGLYAISELSEALQGDFYDNIIKDYPFMKKIPVYECILEEGDALFNPPFWWHTVRNLTEYTVGCANRYWTNKVNSPTFAFCNMYDAVRHPKKSALPTLLRAKKNKKAKGEVFKTLFFGDKKKEVQ